MSYTMDERTVAQQKTFQLKKQGYKATRIVEQVEIDVDKNNKPIYETVLTSFGYSKERAPREILSSEVENYNFVFIYDN